MSDQGKPSWYGRRVVPIDQGGRSPFSSALFVEWLSHPRTDDRGYLRRPLQEGARDRPIEPLGGPGRLAGAGLAWVRVLGYLLFLGLLGAAFTWPIWGGK